MERRTPSGGDCWVCLIGGGWAVKRGRSIRFGGPFDGIWMTLVLLKNVAGRGWLAGLNRERNRGERESTKMS